MIPLSQPQRTLDQHDYDSLEAFHAGRSWDSFVKYAMVYTDELRKNAYDCADARSIDSIRTARAIEDFVTSLDSKMMGIYSARIGK